jgi:hypothetical protein
MMSEDHVSSLSDIPPGAWQALAQKRIFFGHQSVGDNILEGIAELQQEHPEIELNIVETSSPDSFSEPLLAHAKVGRNREPLSKLEAFREILESGIGELVDIAILKLCFIDLDRHSVPDELFMAYEQAMTNLVSRYPRVVFVHCSLPLWSRPLGLHKQLKSWFKKLLGRPGALQDNAKRAEYNDLLKGRYADDAFFDIALLEARRPNGSFDRAGKDQTPMLAREYTSDGGHLNACGRKMAAEQLLMLLARLARS